MEEQVIIDAKEPSKERFYNQFHLGLGTFLGGSIIGGYLLYANFKKLGNTKAANASLIGGIALFVLIVYLLFNYDVLEKVPNVMYVVVQVALVYGIYTGKQKPQLDELEQKHGKTIYYPWWRTVLLSLTVLVPVFIGAFLLTDVLGPSYPDHIEDPKTYTFLSAEVIYDSKDITVDEVAELSEAFVELGSVGANDRISIFYDKVDGTLTVGMIIGEDFRNSPEVNAFWEEFKELLADALNSPIAIELFEEGYTSEPYKVIR